MKEGWIQILAKKADVNSLGQRLEVVTISMSRALSRARASLRLASSSSRKGFEGETSSS